MYVFNMVRQAYRLFDRAGLYALSNMLILLMKRLVGLGWSYFCFFSKGWFRGIFSARGDWMEKHHRLINDPHIMGPLEEFLRTVREVVQFPRLKEDKNEALSPEFLIRAC